MEAQIYLNNNYPKVIRGSIVELLISHQSLTGHLDLSDFINLKRLDCSHNQLESLNLVNNNLLEEVKIHNNLIKSD